MQQIFLLHFNVRYAPTKNTTKDHAEDFRRKISVLNHNSGGATGRPVSVRTGQKIEVVRGSVVENPNKSYRKSSGFINDTIIDVNNTRKKRHQINSLKTAQCSATSKRCSMGRSYPREATSYGRHILQTSVF